jgi:hypothetical protein
LARSSKPRRRSAPARAEFQLTLTRGGGAELIDNETGETVWANTEDPDFLEDFPDFLHRADIARILDYLVDTGELTAQDADRADVREEFIEAADLAGMVRGR